MNFKEYLKDLSESKVINVPKFRTEKEMNSFISNMKPDETPENYIVNPETGEIVMFNGETKRKKAKELSKHRPTPDDSLWIPDWWKDSGEHWEGINAFKRIFNIVTKELSDEVENPQQMLDADYDVNISYPSKVKRKDGKKFNDSDLDAIESYFDWQAYIIKSISPGLQLKYSTSGNIASGVIFFV